MKKFKKKLLVKTPNVKLSSVYERTIKLCYFWLLPKMFLIGRTSWKHSYLARQSDYDNCSLPKIAIIIIPNYPLTVLSLHLTRKLMMDRNMLEDQLSDQNMAVRSNVLHISRHLSNDDDGFDIFLFVKKGEVLCGAGGSCLHDSSIS